VQIFTKDSYKKRLKLTQSGEEGVLQIRALFGFAPITTNVNLPNKGQAPDLRLGQIVETNAVFAENSIEPVNAGKMLPSVRELVARHADNMHDFVDAYFEKDKDKLLKAYLNDNAVARIASEVAEVLFDELIELNKDALEEWLVE
jgi:alpha-galactosidase